jgi:hypothetical protein
VTIEWRGVFTSLSPLIYEVSLGTQVGSTSVRRWSALSQGQSNDEMIVINQPGLTNKNDYVLAINAISFNGKSVTGLYTIDDTIATPV